MSNSLAVALKITGDAKSAVAALEETRRAQLNAFKAGKEAAAESAGRWKAAEAEVRKLAGAARESGTGQGELAAKIREAAAEAARAKQEWQDETAALHRRRQALIENKTALEQANAAARAAPSAVDSGRNLLGLVPHEQIRQQIEQVRQAYLGLKASGQLTGAELAQAADRARTRIAQLAEGMNGARTAGDRMAGAVTLVQRAVVALHAVLVGNAILRVADEMALLRARLTLVEGSAEGAQAALSALSAIAARAQVPVQATATSYNKMAQSIYNLGGSQQDALGVTEALALALRVSGASTQEADAALRQFGQAMQKGSLNGDEFVSVAENGGKVLDYLAEALGVSRGELRRMSTDGELGADKLMKIVNVLDKIKADAASLPQTVGGAVAHLNSQWALWVDSSRTVQAASAGVSWAIKLIADNLDGLVWAGAVAGAALFVTQLGRLRLAVKALLLVLNVGAFTPAGAALTGLAMAVAFVAGKWKDAADAAEAAGGIFASNAKRAEDAARALGQGAKAAGDNIKEALDKAAKRSEELVGELQKHGKQAADNAKTQLDDRLRAIDDHYEKKRIAVENSGLSEQKKSEETARLVVQAERDKLTAVKEWAIGAEDAALKSYDAIRLLAEKNGGDVEQVERESLQTRIELYTQVENAYRATVDKLVAEERRWRDEVERLEKERYLLRQSTEDRIRALRQGAMNPVEAYYDRERQIAEKLAAAQRELLNGNLSEAKRLAEQAMSLAERNAGRVTETVSENGKSVTREVVSQATTSAKAIENVGKAAGIVDKAVAGMGETAAGNMRDAAGAVGEFGGGLTAVAGLVQRTRKAFDEKIKLRVEADEEAVLAAAEKAAELVRAQQLAAEMTVKINGIEDALADLKRTTDASEATKLRLKATADVDAFTKDVVELKRIAERQKLELPAQLQDKPLWDSIDRLKGYLAEPTSATHKPDPDLSRYRAAVAELQKPTSSTHTIYVRRVEQHAIGGLVGMSQMAAGVRYLNTGGHLPGYGGGDRIRALLEAGEFVVRKEAVRHYGLAALQAINAMRVPLPVRAAGEARLPGFSTGGPVGRVAAGRAGDVVDIRVQFGARRIELQGARDQAMALAGALRELSRGA